MHIKSCARKRALTTETIRILILQEVEKATLPDTSATGNSRDKAVETSNTLMMDLVDGAAPKKKSKRPEVTHTIKTVIDTRESILERARAVLDNIDSPLRAEDVYENPSQVFQPSKLAGSLHHIPQSPLVRDSDGLLLPNPERLSSRTDTSLHRTIPAAPIMVRMLSPTEIASD